jgi:hypothetical protein
VSEEGEMERRTLGAVVVALALAATGCGGGGDKQLTHSELVSQAGTICKRLQREATRVFRRARRGNEASVRAELAAVANRRVDELDGLKPPSADSERFDGYVKALRVEIAAITSGSGSGSGRKTGDQRRQQQASEAAKRYKEQVGLRNCI